MKLKELLAKVDELSKRVSENPMGSFEHDEASGTLADLSPDLARRLKKAWWALKKARGREPLAHEFVCQTLDEIEEPPER